MAQTISFPQGLMAALVVLGAAVMAPQLAIADQADPQTVREEIPVAEIVSAAGSKTPSQNFADRPLAHLERLGA